MPRTSRKNSGFTLIEVLVAVGLGAVLLTALYATFFSVFTAGGRSRESLDSHIQAGRLLDRFTQDIHAAYFRAGDERTVFSGQSKAMTSAIEMTSFVNPVMKKGSPAGDLTGIGYLCEEAAGGLVVYREVWSPFSGEKVRYELMTGVRGFDVSYYNGRSWSKAWDAALERALPTAVKLTLKLKTGEEVSALARTMITVQ